MIMIQKLQTLQAKYLILVKDLVKKTDFDNKATENENKIPDFMKRLTL